MKTYRMNGDNNHLYFQNMKKRTAREELITIMDILTSQGCVIKDKIAGYDCDLYTCGLWLFSAKTEQTMYGSFEICVPKNGENPYVFTVTDTDGFKLWNNAKLILEKKSLTLL